MKTQFLIAYCALTTGLRKESRKGGKTHDNEQNEQFHKKQEILSSSVLRYVIQPLLANTGSKFCPSERDRGRDFHGNRFREQPPMLGG